MLTLLRRVHLVQSTRIWFTSYTPMGREMAIRIGSHAGFYEILSAIGAGGMGESTAPEIPDSVAA